MSRQSPHQRLLASDHIAAAIELMPADGMKELLKQFKRLVVLHHYRQSRNLCRVAEQLGMHRNSVSRLLKGGL